MRTLLAAFFLAAPLARAAESGYVVKAQADTVYVDLGADSGAEVGRGVDIYTEGEELKHPVTGASLGKVQNDVVRGKITQVQPKFSVVKLDAAAAVKTGFRARLAPVTAPSAPASAPAGSSLGGDLQGLRGARVKGPTFDFAIRGLALGDFTGEGKRQLALASPTGVTVYPYPPVNSTPAAEWKIPSSAPRPLSLEAADLDGDGRDELFLSNFSEALGRVETVVLAFSTGPGLQKTADLPYLTRSVQDETGKVILAGQQLVDDVTFPFGAVMAVQHKDGRYSLSGKKIPHRRADWLWSFTHAELDGKPALVYLTTTDHIRVQFDSGYFKTRDAFGQTPVRLRWPPKDGGKLLEFHPRMRVGKINGKSVIYAIRNISMLGSLSEPFGLFNSGEVKRLSWNGVALETDWKGELGGFSTAFELFPSVNDPRELVVAVSGSAGKSSVWIFDP